MRISGWSSDVCSSDLDAAGVSLPATAVWSPDGRWIYYRALMDGKIDVWRAASDGSGAEPITLDVADVRGFSLSDDGLTLVYRVRATREEVIEAEQAEYDRGIRIDKMVPIGQGLFRSEEHTSELQSLMRSSYAVFSMKKKK